MNENSEGETGTGHGPALRPRADERDVRDLIMRVGRRVRAARLRRSLSRRVLSETSGVSQRYLAQLETGEGNISISLLLKVANALGHRIEWLVGEEDPWTSEALGVADMFRSATAQQKTRVLNILNPVPASEQRSGRVALIGLRGAGKSTMGRLMGEEFGVPFVELNRDIEAQVGMPVGEILAFYGQEGYRKLEKQALAHAIAAHSTFVLAVAGGIVSEPETYNLLLDRFHTVWLRARPEDHMERVRAQGDERPMAGNPGAMAELRSILTSRDELYRQAEISLDTSDCSVAETHKALGSLIRSRRFLG